MMKASNNENYTQRLTCVECNSHENRKGIAQNDLNLQNVSITKITGIDVLMHSKYR